MLMINAIRALCVLFAVILYGFMTNNLVTTPHGFAVLAAAFAGFVAESLLTEFAIDRFNRSKDTQKLRL